MSDTIVLPPSADPLSIFNIEPLENRIVIREIKTAEKVGSIFIPEGSREKSYQAVVVAAGPGKRADDGTLIPPFVHVGDTVLYGKYSGTDIKVDGEDYIVARESDILAVVKRADKIEFNDGPAEYMAADLQAAE